MTSDKPAEIRVHVGKGGDISLIMTDNGKDRFYRLSKEDAYYLARDLLRESGYQGPTTTQQKGV